MILYVDPSALVKRYVVEAGAAIGEAVTVATFDRQLWRASGAVGLTTWPENLDRFGSAQ